MNCEQCLDKCKAVCCGVVPFDQKFFEAHAVRREVLEIQKMEKDGKDVVIPMTRDFVCPYLDKNYKCSVYTERPEICRSFGTETHPLLICPYQTIDGRLRSRQERREIERKAIKRMNIPKV